MGKAGTKAAAVAPRGKAGNKPVVPAGKAGNKPVVPKGNKREAEDAVQKAQAAKKQKKAPPPPKKDESSSSEEEESGSESEEEVKVQTKEVTEPVEQESSDDDGSDVSSETDEDMADVKDAEKESSSDEEKEDDDESSSDEDKEDDDDEHDEEDEEPAKKSEKPDTPMSTKSEGTVAKTLYMGNVPCSAELDQVKEFFQEAGEVIDVRFPVKENGTRKRFCYVDFGTVEAAQKAIKFNGRELMGQSVKLDFAEKTSKKPKTPMSTQSEGTGAKTLYMGGVPFSAEFDQVKEFFQEAGEVIDVRFPVKEDGTRKHFCYVEFGTVEAAQKAIKFNGKELMGRSVKLDFTDKTSKKPKTPMSTQSQGTEAKTLFMGNVPYSAEFDQVKQFFQEAGEVIDFRCPVNENGKRKNFAYVEFGTVEAAQKAVKFTGRELMGRSVKLDFAGEKGAKTPQSRVPSFSVFIRGFDKSLSEDKIRSSLKQHFAECGEITRVSIPTDKQTEAIKGIAYMDFKDQDSQLKALARCDSVLDGCELYVDDASSSKGISRGGSRSGGRFGGRSGGRRGGGRFGGRGRFGGQGRGRGRQG